MRATPLGVRPADEGRPAQIHFYNIVSIIYGSCQEFCTATSCPVMSAGPKYQYLWSDTNDGKSPRAVSAPEYMALLFDWIEACIGNAGTGSVRVAV